MDLTWSGSAGVFSLESQRPLEVAHAFRIASMSKTFTGLLVAQLMEQQLLAVDDSILDYLPTDITAHIRVAPGYNPRDITIAHLLHHRAGFNDFATSAAWHSVIAADPGRYRSPQEIIAWALQQGEVIGPPGSTYHYSDTGYVLLGLLLEAVTGLPYHRLCRERIFDPLAMVDTWLEGYETPRKELSHPYVVMEGAYIDALQIHGSVDWAGGGHVATLADIQRFLRGLFNGDLFTREETLNRMLAGSPAGHGFIYGMGVGRKKLAGKTLWGHLGHWGSFMYYCPEERLSLCGTLNYDQADHNGFIEQIIACLFAETSAQ
ncbi:MAG: serine hydrolase domain-containing protein [Haliea sp.]